MSKEQKPYSIKSQSKEKVNEILRIIDYRFKLIEGELYKRNASFGTFDNVSNKNNFKILGVYISNLKIVEYLKTGNFTDVATNSKSVSTGVSEVNSGKYKRFRSFLKRNGQILIDRRFRTKEEAIMARARVLYHYYLPLEKNT